MDTSAFVNLVWVIASCTKVELHQTLYGRFKRRHEGGTPLCSESPFNRIWATLSHAIHAGSSTREKKPVFISNSPMSQGRYTIPTEY